MPDSKDVTLWRVLIVDDDQDNQTLAAEYLKYVGATVRTARDGFEGLAAAVDFAPTIILLDLSMPNMDGWTMFEKLRADAALATIPVIALTAHALPQDRERVVAAGFDGYVTKPFIFRILVEEMKRWLSRREQPPKPPEAQPQPDAAAATPPPPPADAAIATPPVTQAKDQG